MNSRRSVASILTVVLLGIALAGCAPKKKPVETVYMTMGTAGISGSFYPIGLKACEIWNKAIPNLKAVAIATAGSPQNVEMMRTKDSEVAVIGSLDSYAAINGIEGYKEKSPWIMAITGGLYMSGTQILAQKNGTINDVMDLKGKKVAIGEPGGAGAADVELVLKNLGITLKDFTPMYLGDSQAMDQLKDGLIDAAFLGLTVGSPGIAEVMLSGRVKLVPISDGAFAKMKAADPIVQRISIPKGTYANMDSDVATAAEPPTILAVRGDLVSEEMQYQMTKAIYENITEFRKAVAAVKNTSIDTVKNGLLIPFAPGSLRYFKEKGITPPPTLTR